MLDKIEQRKPTRSALTYIVISVLTLALIAAGVLLVVHSANDYTVWVELRGDSEITLEYGESFTDAGAEGWRQGKLYNDEAVALDVTTGGEFNPSVIGTYQLTYTAEFKGITATATRTIKVVDTVAPTIELITSPDSFTLPGADYVEEGFTASDNYDGDLTNKVQRVQKDGVVIYTVEDSSGNRAEITRKLVYNDITAPVITLNGKTWYTVSKGDVWKDPGFSAIDDADGDVTDKVVASGTVNTDVLGTYTITYTVTDNYGNTSSATRNVVVREFAPPTTEPTGDKVIYLTFDDGPSKYTKQLLEVLDKYGVKATFFVCDTGYKEVLADIAAGGHSLAIHSMTHEYKTIYASEEAFFADILAVQEMIRTYAGVETYLLRFPGGSSNTASRFNPGIMTRLTALVEERGFTYFDWNVDSMDAGGAKTADEVYKNVINGVKNKKNSVVLQHDIRKYSVEAVERIIQWGMDNGYTFEALDANSPTAHHPVRN